MLGLSPAAGVLFGSSSQAIATNASKARAFSSGGKGSIPAPRNLQGSRASKHGLLSPVLSGPPLVATFGQEGMSGSAAVAGSSYWELVVLQDRRQGI